MEKNHFLGTNIGLIQRNDLTTGNVLFENKTYADEKGLSTENQLSNCETFYFEKIFL